MKDNTDQTSSVKDFSADDEILTQTNEQEQNNQNANDDELVNFDELVLLGIYYLCLIRLKWR